MKVRLVDLPDIHPALLWDDILAATVSVLEDQGAVPYRIPFELENVPGYGTGRIALETVPTGVPAEDVVKSRRTFEAHRRIEFAAIAVAGLALFHSGGHQIRDVALRGSSADYLVDDEGRLLEIAGRSRRSDFHAAWDIRWQRLTARIGSDFYVCVVEFQTPAGRLAFAGQ